MAWQSPHAQRGSAFESHRDTAADRGVPAGHALRLDQLLAAAAGWGCGAHRANGGPWHQHLAHISSHQSDKPPNRQTAKPALSVVQCVTQVFLSCFCCWTSCEVMLATGAKHLT